MHTHTHTRLNGMFLPKLEDELHSMFSEIPVIVLMFVCFDFTNVSLHKTVFEVPIASESFKMWHCLENTLIGFLAIHKPEGGKQKQIRISSLFRSQSKCISKVFCSSFYLGLNNNMNE